MHELYYSEFIGQSDSIYKIAHINRNCRSTGCLGIFSLLLRHYGLKEVCIRLNHIINWGYIRCWLNTLYRCIIHLIYCTGFSVLCHNVVVYQKNTFSQYYSSIQVSQHFK